MIFRKLSIEGAFAIEIEPAEDERGFFARTFSAREFENLGLETHFVQRSISHNRRRGTLRGLHFQASPHSETKLVRCPKGGAFDVIVDLRPESPTFGQWASEELSDRNHRAVYIPRGCAHGFQALADGTELAYEITPEYQPQTARGIRWDDPSLAIPWPIEPILSPRDLALLTFSEITAEGSLSVQ
jgi:dTDP-4-dehydrorhamnose 3,5-epimerase